MATGPYDLGPFQTLSAINFAQGGIFGYVSSVGLGSKITTRGEVSTGFATCTALTLTPLTWTPTRTFPDEQATRLTMLILVGEDWRDHVINPFPGELSESPGDEAIAGMERLNSLTQTHLASERSYKIDDLATNGKRCDLGPGPSDYWAIWGTTAGQVYSEPAPPNRTIHAATQYWLYAASLIGTSQESWFLSNWYNDTNNPATNFPLFWDVASADDKVTFT